MKKSIGPRALVYPTPVSLQQHIICKYGVFNDINVPYQP